MGCSQSNARHDITKAQSPRVQTSKAVASPQNLPAKTDPTTTIAPQISDSASIAEGPPPHLPKPASLARFTPYPSDHNAPSDTSSHSASAYYTCPSGNSSKLSSVPSAKFKDAEPGKDSALDIKEGNEHTNTVFEVTSPISVDSESDESSVEFKAGVDDVDDINILENDNDDDNDNESEHNTTTTTIKDPLLLDSPHHPDLDTSLTTAAVALDFDSSCNTYEPDCSLCFRDLQTTPPPAETTLSPPLSPPLLPLGNALHSLEYQLPKEIKKKRKKRCKKHKKRCITPPLIEAKEEDLGSPTERDEDDESAVPVTVVVDREAHLTEVAQQKETMFKRMAKRILSGPPLMMPIKSATLTVSSPLGVCILGRHVVSVKGNEAVQSPRDMPAVYSPRGGLQSARGKGLSRTVSVSPSPRRRLRKTSSNLSATSNGSASDCSKGLQVGMIISAINGIELDVKIPNHARTVLKSVGEGEEVTVKVHIPYLRQSDYLLPGHNTPYCAPRGLEAARLILGSFEYTKDGPTFDVDKKRSLAELHGTAAEILRDGVRIQCVEGAFVALLLTHHLTSVVRFSLSFQSRTPEGTIYKHIVMGLRCGKHYGALGISRGKGLMTKDTVFPSLNALISDYVYHYTLEEHLVQKVLISRPISRAENVRPEWKAFRYEGIDNPQNWEDFKTKLKVFEHSWVTESTVKIGPTSPGPRSIPRATPRGPPTSPASPRSLSLRRSRSGSRETAYPSSPVCV